MSKIRSSRRARVRRSDVRPELRPEPRPEPRVDSRSPSALQRPAADRQPGVLHLVAEYLPYIRTGGLAEAVRGIADGQARTGREAVVMLPLHRAIQQQHPQLRPLGVARSISTPEGPQTVQLFEDPETSRDRGQPRALFVAHEPSFDRTCVYGEGRDYADNHTRFALLARTALDVLPELFDTPPVLHLHDWHAALAAIVLRTEHRGNAYFDAVSSVLTVHNAGYQGHLVPDTWAQLGLSAAPDVRDRLEWFGLLNLLKGGLHFADMVTTVSPTHATELRTETGGFGLHDTFGQLEQRFVGILNGIDAEVWNPERDPLLAAPYSSRDLAGKAMCKRDFQQEAGLQVDAGTPLFAMSARLVEQKGFDVLLNSGLLTRRDLQWAFLGEGEPRYRDALAALAHQSPHRITCRFDFSDDQEHRLLAAADVLLMPSLYEPCGLTQMRAQRYGAIPIVRRVGGLADTVEHGVTGLVFDRYAPDALVETVQAAVRLYRDGAAWQRRVRAAMERDFGWAGPVRGYDEVYRAAMAQRAA